MRTRNIKKQIWLNKEEATLLRKKSKKAGVSEAEIFRKLLLGTELREKPDEKFYEYMKEIRAIGNNLNQIARKANMNNGFIDEVMYKKEAKKWNKYIIDIKKRYL